MSSHPYREPADREDAEPKKPHGSVLVGFAILAVAALGTLAGYLAPERSVTPLLATVAVLVALGTLAFDRRR